MTTNCINCGAPLDPTLKQCHYCGSKYFTQNETIPWNYFLKSRKIRTHAIYPLLLLIGVCLVIFIYGIEFDHFSETALIQITPMWFFPIVFGTFGFTAEKMLHYVAAGEAPTIGEAYRKWIKTFVSKHLLIGLIVSIFLFPFSFFKNNYPLLIAFLGSAIWGILLLIFFNGIFPSL